MIDTDAPKRLPHSGPALLIERVAAVEDDVIHCIGRVPPDSPFRSGAEVPAYLGIEMGAQAAALQDLLARDAQCDAEAHGFIVAVRTASFQRAQLPADAAFEVEARREVSMPPLHHFSLRVSLDGNVVVEAEVSTYVPE
jgi:predicted hotdog family 3-hydroxylacyl-ACP dehydratase